MRLPHRTCPLPPVKAMVRPFLSGGRTPDHGPTWDRTSHAECPP